MKLMITLAPVQGKSLSQVAEHIIANFPYTGVNHCVTSDLERQVVTVSMPRVAHMTVEQQQFLESAMMQGNPVIEDVLVRSDDPDFLREAQALRQRYELEHGPLDTRIEEACNVLTRLPNPSRSDIEGASRHVSLIKQMREMLGKYEQAEEIFLSKE
jgi:hypothetical protein